MSVFVRKQQGAVLILMMFIIGLAVAAYTLKAFNAASLQSQQDEQTMQVLGEAKQALIAWAVSHPINPGQLPFPDRSTGGGYDGKSDCYTGTFQYSFLLGRLPLIGQSNPCINPHTGVGGDWLDAQGNRLWYAVSRNLVHEYQAPSSDPVINPSIINNPNYQWLQVLDRNGNLISNRVAAVIISPGEPLGGQDRSSSTAGASEYLDSFMIGAATYSNRGYATDDEDFIFGEDGRHLSASDITFQRPYYFNDKLIYITVDELMEALEHRSALTARQALINYKNWTSNYPHAAMLGSTNNHSCISSNLKGFLPTESKNPLCSCNWGSSRSCKCAFTDVDSISFTKTSGAAFSASYSVGACTRLSSTTCSCNGAGSCSSSTATTNFTCLTDGSCTSTVNGSYTFYGAFNGATGGCSLNSSPGCPTGNNNSVSCSSTGGLSFLGCAEPPFNSIITNSALPAWFSRNKWQDYIYYDASLTITVGNRAGIEALLISTGASIINAPFAASKNAAQTKPSCSSADYLDSIENANGDNVYDRVGVPRSSSYNDKSFIISP
ncbi:MAG TPA: hypothetical protein VK974_11410 [Methylophilaceae bacterium]|nr:hypothetical protein [Methylophilaceae bacterium]